MLGRMIAVLLIFVGAFAATASPADARRLALVIGQTTYPGSKSATLGLSPLPNAANDVQKVASLLAKHGFEVISCGGPRAQAPNGGTPTQPGPGCFNLDRDRLQRALSDFQANAKGADTALIYFAGHGMASEAGNILTPIDAKVNCTTGAITHGVPVERFLAATEPARHKLVILDACRNNPIGEVCPALKGKKLSFTRIEAGAMQGLLLVTSTQFGQEALDGAGAHSPFATSLIAALEDNPGVYFEQVMNEVARATYDTALKEGNGFKQIPGKVVGGVAPADCLSGKSCVGDQRMAQLEKETDGLKAALSREAELAATAKSYLAAAEKQRGRPLSEEERRRELANLEAATTELAARTDTRGEEALKRLGAGDAAAARQLFAEAAAARKQAAAAAAERAKAENREAAKSLRHLAALAPASNVVEAMDLYKEATELDPEDAGIWIDYARTAMTAKRLDVAQQGFAQADLKARQSNNFVDRYWAAWGLGEVASTKGDLQIATLQFERMIAIANSLARTDRAPYGWQFYLFLAYIKFGDALSAQHNLPAALDAFKASLVIAERLATASPADAAWQYMLGSSHDRVGNVQKTEGNLDAALKSFQSKLHIISHLAIADPKNATWQSELSVTHDKIGDVLRAQGNQLAALDAFNASAANRARAIESSPANSAWQRALSASHTKIGNLLFEQGNQPGALEAFQGALNIAERLAKSDPSNAVWQRDLATSYQNLGRVYAKQKNVPATRDAFNASLAVTERLAKGVSGSSVLLREHALNLMAVGMLEGQFGERQRALALLGESREIIDRLRTASPTDATLQGALTTIDEGLARLKQK